MHIFSCSSLFPAYIFLELFAFWPSESYFEGQFREVLKFCLSLEGPFSFKWHKIRGLSNSLYIQSYFKLKKLFACLLAHEYLF